MYVKNQYYCLLNLLDSKITTVQFTYGEFALAKFRISGRKSSSPDFPLIEINVNMVRLRGILVSGNNAYVERLLCSQ